MKFYDIKSLKNDVIKVKIRPRNYGRKQAQRRLVMRKLLKRIKLLFRKKRRQFRVVYYQNQHGQIRSKLKR